MRPEESSFGLSYSRLPSETANVFRLLSVFPADFDAPAEEVICQDEGHRHLSELVRWSLVEYDSATERCHLHDLVRIFAASRLPAGEKSTAEERHAEHFKYVLSASGEQYKQGGESILAGLALFDREWANIQAGWAWAERNWEDSPVAARICSSYPDAGALVLDLRLHPREKIRWLETAVAAARSLMDRSAEGRHLGNLGNAHANLGETRKAIKHFEKALAISKEIGDRRIEGVDLGNLGNARKAIEHYQQALAIARKIGVRRNEGAWLGNLGSAYFSLGEEKKALDFYERQMEIARDIDDRSGEGNALWGQAICYEKMNDKVRAIKNAEEALKIFEQIESPSAATMRELLSDWRSR